MSDLQELQADINTCFEKSEKFNRAASVAFTFIDLLELLQPLAKSMGFGRARAPEYRLDTVLCVESDLEASCVGNNRLKVSGAHFHKMKTSEAVSVGHQAVEDQCSVEVMLEAPSTDKAEEWVR